MHRGFTVYPYFYPRPPRGGRRHWLLRIWQQPSISIHALREEGDLKRFSSAPAHCHFYPRPPRGGRRLEKALGTLCRNISIHALREEGDPEPTGLPLHLVISIHALREEGDAVPAKIPPQGGISIHALREEGDSPFPQDARPSENFYPRPPRGGRRYSTGDC